MTHDPKGAKGDGSLWPLFGDKENRPLWPLLLVFQMNCTDFRSSAKAWMAFSIFCTVLRVGVLRPVT